MAALSVLSPGLLSTLQDKGRLGMRHLGIPWAGTLCPAWQAIANTMAGNPADHVVIECFEGPLRLRAEASDVLLAIVGCPHMLCQHIGDGRTLSLTANRSMRLPAGHELLIRSTGELRQAVIAVNGLSISRHLGSCSTYTKAALGGLCGRALQHGDTLPISHTQNSAQHAVQCTLADALRYTHNTIRVLPGPQFDHFSDRGISCFLHTEYALTEEADRMGTRLQGQVIEHRDSNSADIVSDAIVPGNIQVPRSGQPIVLLNDAQTAGGYPKIATVLSCDLPVLGLQRPGSTVRFQCVDIDTALTLRRQHQQAIVDSINTAKGVRDDILDSRKLLTCNLIDGVTDGIDDYDH